MKIKDKKTIVIIILLLVSTAASWNLYFKEYVQKDTVDIHQFPRTIHGWSSEEIPITEDEYAILETHNAFVRKYSGPQGKEVYLFIVYSQNNRKVSHPPEICYTGGGFTILNKDADTIKMPDANQVIHTKRLTMERGNLKQLTYYWFKVGETFTSSYVKQQFLIAVKSLLGKPSSSAMISVSAVINPGGKARSMENIKEFSRLILPDIVKYLK